MKGGRESPLEGGADPAGVLIERLRARSLTLALAESCTGGLVAKRLTDPAGASAVMIGGLVAYANSVKTELLGVSSETLGAHGAVSAETAREMAAGARRLFGTDLALSITGIAGPSGGTSAKPVGTVWIGTATGEGVEANLFHFSGDRRAIREQAAATALSLLGQLLMEQV